MASESGTSKGAGKLASEIIRRAGRALIENTEERPRSYFPVVSYGEFLLKFKWEQGEHITLIGPTKSGKTTLALDLLSMRDFVIVLGTKAKDSTMDKLIKRGYIRLQKWSEHDKQRRVIVWPNIRNVQSAAEAKVIQQEVFREVLNAAFRETAWCVYLDELRYITDYLKLSEEVEILWQQGRSLDVSVVAGNQRPRHIPLLAYDQATHLFFWRDIDIENIARMSEFTGYPKDVIVNTILNLKKHEFLYMNPIEQIAMISKVEL